jgi:uncharacterized protein (DUF608 family)
MRLCLIIALFSMSSLWALSKTKGTPLGGLGTGYVIYDAVTGDFATSGKVPPPGSDGVSEFSNKKSTSSGLHFYVAGTEGKKKATTTEEDAKCPLYTAAFPAVGSVKFTLHAHGPFMR